MRCAALYYIESRAARNHSDSPGDHRPSVPFRPFARLEFRDRDRMYRRYGGLRTDYYYLDTRDNNSIDNILRWRCASRSPEVWATGPYTINNNNNRSRNSSFFFTVFFPSLLSYPAPHRPVAILDPENSLRIHIYIYCYYYRVHGFIVGPTGIPYLNTIDNWTI